MLLFLAAFPPTASFCYRGHHWQHCYAGAGAHPLQWGDHDHWLLAHRWGLPEGSCPQAEVPGHCGGVCAVLPGEAQAGCLLQVLRCLVHLLNSCLWRQAECYGSSSAVERLKTARYPTLCPSVRGLYLCSIARYFCSSDKNWVLISLQLQCRRYVPGDQLDSPSF